MTQNLQVYKVTDIDDNIFKQPNDKFESNYQTKPLFNLGFHSFIHRTKSKMEKIGKLETKNKFYLVVNPYEHKIQGYNNSVSDITNEYLNLGDTRILTRAFYKMWEILMIFDVANNDVLTYGALAEGPGSFIQAVYYYRQKILGNNLAKDKYFGVTINSKDLDITDDFTKLMNKKHPNLFVKHTGDTGDLTKITTINNFSNHFKQKKADLVTADGGFDWKDENYQEQEAYQLVMGQILSAIKIQNKDGNFVLKIFDMFTSITIKMICFLKFYYEEVYIYKPYMSRASNSEKYLICKKFKFDDPPNLKFMEKVLENLQSDIYVNHIIINYNPPNEIMNLVKYVNIKLANIQQMQINKMIAYIDSNNHYGEAYHSYLEVQKKSTQFWLETFYPKSSDEYKQTKENINKLILKNITTNNEDIKILLRKIN